jgi:AcrR family transcriptional regulator
MLWAATTELRERGFVELTVSQIIARARVSRVTFYRAFDGKLDCVLAAHQAAIAELELRVRQAYRERDVWAQGMAGAIEALLGFAAESPDKLHMILFVNNGAGEPRLAQFGLAMRERLIAAIRESRGEAASTPDELSEQAAMGAVIAVLEALLEIDDPKRLPEIKAYLIGLVLTPYLDEIEAGVHTLAGRPQAPNWGPDAR